ncbi:hypothetical protein [Desulfobacter postgatei]|uniref:hypothetical protein n=1 Tax=Desulfobacter postgatei TaxID=2293 RepID=UPI00259AF404|nr:hypothetical protein [uncultured Desulfobacter sp.]
MNVTLSEDMEWRAPAVCTSSYFIASATRPKGLQRLQKEDGRSAFSDGNLVILATLMPETELRLWTLTQPIPQPDGSALTAANTASRPRVRYLALEIPAASATNMTAIENLRENNFPVDISTEDDKAAFLGLTSTGSLGNAEKPVSELHRPAADSAVILQNRTGSPLSATLWCFDYRGKPLDAGAVANWWSYMASPGIWDNLWAHPDAADQRTAAVTAGNLVHISNAHEGPLGPALLARLNLTDLSQVAGSTALYQAGASPAIGLTAAPDPDNAPIPRIAALPNGNYQPPATATPFAGWTGSTWPAGITRDFIRIAFTDIEQHVVGLTRSDSQQASERSRISPGRNTAAPAVFTTNEPVTRQIMTTLTNGANAIVMSPVMDNLWGSVTLPALANNAVPDAISFTIHPLAGEGTTNAGGSSEGQSILVHFEAGALPDKAWIRIWPHGLDTTTGIHFPLDGGAALSDATGQAYVVVPIPDGAGGTTDPNDTPVYLDFDILVVTGNDSRYYMEQRFERPATQSGSKVTLPAGTTVSAGTSLWRCEAGAAFNRGAAEYQSGENLLSIPDDPATGQFALVDLTSLAAADINATTLFNATGAGDTLITTSTAFATTPEGELISGTGPNGSTLLYRGRNALNELTTMGRPVPSMERREVAAIDTGNTGVVGAMPGRAKNHEAAPPQLGHPGVAANAEIHSTGIALAGPAVDSLRPLMEERHASNLAAFLGNVGTPVTPTADPGGTTTWSVVLETLTHGVAGDSIIRALLAATPTFAPGQTWTQIKAAINSLPGVDLDSLIDTATFDDDALANAVDNLIAKTKNGATQFATAVQAAIGRAEDYVYVETPALDAQSANSSAINIVEAIKTRWTARPGLTVIMAVPEKYLPKQTPKVESVRKAGINAAFKELVDTAPDRVVLFTPTAGSARPWHMASTTVIVDDALLLTGSTHLWRRGLTFDSSLAVGLFDENVTFGRPTAVRATRLQLMANALGLPLNLVPDDPQDCLAAVRQLNTSGGLMRVKPNVYSAKANTVSTTDLNVWNPDGTLGGTSDWFVFIAALTGDTATEFNNAIR